MSDDYIKRVDAIEKINNALKRVFVEDMGQEILASIPSADVVPMKRYKSMENTCVKLQKALADVAPVRHGRWIEYGENKDGTHNICCSVCDGFFKSKGHANSCYTRNKYRYCHGCGARMDGEDK